MTNIITGRYATWGLSAGSAFKDSKYSLVLTGTPIRTDVRALFGLATPDGNKLSHSQDGTYQLSYGEAIPQYCRPATFHRWEENFL